MRTPIPGITSFEQEEMLFDLKRPKQGPKRPYPRVYGQLYKGKVTTDGWDTRVKVCDVPTPIDDLQDCSPKCPEHPHRYSQGVVRRIKMIRRKQTTFWESACSVCLSNADSKGIPIRRHA